MSINREMDKEDVVHTYNEMLLSHKRNKNKSFVDKWMGRMAIGPFGFEEMYHLSQQTMLLAVVLDGVAICRSIANGRAMHLITPFYIACFAGLYLFFSVSEAADIRRRRRILKINLVDYLENHLSSRILTTKEDMEMLGLKPGTTIEMIPMGKRSPNEFHEKGSPNEFHEKEPDSMEIQREEAQQNILPENAEGTGNAEEDNSRAVTQEELEALLKEFLVVQ